MILYGDYHHEINEPNISDALLRNGLLLFSFITFIQS